MARIRTTKPEFWTSEQVVECSPIARLLFIGIWNFCDDNGIHPDSAKRLKMEIFPSDSITATEIQAMVDELINARLLAHYIIGGLGFWRVTGWAKHQKIERPTYRHPLPDSEKFDEYSPTPHRAVGEQSARPRVRNGMESNGTGMESNGMEVTNPVGLVVASVASNRSTRVDKSAKPDCPHQKIIDLYHELLPTCPQVRDWTAARSTQLRGRWNENPKHQTLDYWRAFFEYVAKSKFLTGQKAGKDGRVFTPGLDWLVKSESFAKIREGRYHVEDEA